MLAMNPASFCVPEKSNKQIFYHEGRGIVNPKIAKMIVLFVFLFCFPRAAVRLRRFRLPAQARSCRWNDFCIPGRALPESPVCAMIEERRTAAGDRTAAQGSAPGADSQAGSLP
jgi:hypothetical protein